jgi:hypothetical protein
MGENPESAPKQPAPPLATQVANLLEWVASLVEVVGFQAVKDRFDARAAERAIAEGKSSAKSSPEPSED